MIGKIIAAIAGQRLSRHAVGLGGPGGALLGVGVATIVRRLGPAGLVTTALGGWALRKYLEKHPGGAAGPSGNEARKPPSKH